MYAFLVVSLAFLGSSQALKHCTDNSQCDGTECCQILSEFMIVSRRDLAQSLLPPQKLQRSGTCHPYSYEGDNCNSFDKANGYCSCAPGLTCKGQEIYIGTPPPTTVPQPQAIGKRSMVPPRPGYQWEYKCRKI